MDNLKNNSSLKRSINHEDNENVFIFIFQKRIKTEIMYLFI